MVQAIQNTETAPATTEPTAPATPAPAATPKPAAKPKATPAPKKPAGKPAKAAPAKKALANGTAKASATGSSSFLQQSAGDRKTTLVKLLRKFGATSAGSGKSARELADKLGCERKDVRVIACGGSTGKADDSPTCLVATGHVKMAADGHKIAFYLTAKGKSTSFDGAPFARSAS